MKKFISGIVLWLFAFALSLMGCGKRVSPEPIPEIIEQKVVHFVAKAPETKAVFGNKVGSAYPTLWTEDDKIAVSLNFGSPLSFTVKPNGDGRTATFDADMKETAVPATFYAMSPYSAYVGKDAQSKSLSFALSDTQKPIQTSVDKNAIIMVAQSGAYATWPKQAELSFSHIVAYGKFSLKNISAAVNINRIKLEFSQKIAGKFSFYPSSGNLEEGDATNIITIDAANLTGSNSEKEFWFAIKPAELSGTQLRAYIYTNAGIYQKQITFSASNGNFQTGRIMSFSLDMDGITPLSEDQLEIYVSPTGSDSAPGTSQQPLKTLQTAIDKAAAGSRVYLMNGVWNKGFKLTKSGSSVAPIVIMAAPGATPIIDGGNGEGWSMDTEIGKKLLSDFDATNAGLPAFNSDQALITIEGASHVELRGLTVTGSSASGIFCGKGASYIVVENCTVTNCVAPGICFGADNTPSSNIKVLNNYVKNCSQRSREAISLRTVDVFEVANNTVEKVIKESIDAKSGCTNGSIHHNKIVNSGHCGIYMDAGFANTKPQTNIEVYCNSVINGYGTAICVASEAGNNCNNIKIYNNLAYIHGAESHGCGIKVALNSSDKSGLIKNVHIYNNTVYGFGQQGIYVNYPTIENIVIANNISVRTLDNIALNAANGVPAAQLHVTRNLYFGSKASYAGTDSINEDPLFTDPAAGLFTLKEGSPAIDAARGTWVAKTDFTGKGRQQGKEDLGAFER